MASEIGLNSVLALSMAALRLGRSRFLLYAHDLSSKGLTPAHRNSAASVANPLGGVKLMMEQAAASNLRVLQIEIRDLKAGD